MKKIFILIFLLCNVFIFCACSKETAQCIKVNSDEYEKNMKRDLLCIMIGYKGFVTDIYKDKEGYVYLITKDNKKILYDDKKQKSFLEKQHNPDIQDMLEQIYPMKNVKEIMPFGFDPGRIRNYQLLNAVYGYEKSGVEQNLSNVNAGANIVRFNKNNNCAKHLKIALDESFKLAKENSQIYSFIYPLSGTFNYRYISETSLLSPHSYGIAIDLAKDDRDYWKWTSKEKGQTRIASYSDELVKIFENNYFIWGGKWSHFDTLHFEYRPEIILKGKYFSEKSEKEWYSPMEKNKENTIYINLINEKLGVFK